MPKFLIVRFSSIGDIVLTSPVVRCLKTQVPGAEVHFLTRNTFADLLKFHPLIDRLWTSDGSLDDVAEELKVQKFDYVIDLHHNIRTLKLKRLLGVTSFSFNKLNFEKWLLVNFHVNRLPGLHIVDRYLATLNKFGVKNDFAGLDFYPEPGASKVLDLLPGTHRNAFLAVAIGAQHTTKMMPSEKISRVLKMLNIPVVLLGGKEDRVRGTQIEMSVKSMVWNACGQTSLGESAELLKASKVVLSHDTGLMHIAAAFRKPVVSVWGNTIPEFGMTPYMPGNENLSVIIQAHDLKCRPCTKIGFDKCPKGHFHCMRNIPEEEIANAVRSFYF